MSTGRTPATLRREGPGTGSERERLFDFVSTPPTARRTRRTNRPQSLAARWLAPGDWSSASATRTNRPLTRRTTNQLGPPAAPAANSNRENGRGKLPVGASLKAMRKGGGSAPGHGISTQAHYEHTPRAATLDGNGRGHLVGVITFRSSLMAVRGRSRAGSGTRRTRTR